MFLDAFLCNVHEFEKSDLNEWMRCCAFIYAIYND